MKFKKYTDNKLGETVYCGKHPSGLEIRILPKEGYTSTYAVFGVKYGSIDTAVKNSVPQEELPKKLYIISDMEFDFCADDASATNFECAKKRFHEAGYVLPEIVFWNVASRNRQQPVTMNEQGVALVSGCTPRLFEMAASGTVNPYAFMLEVIDSVRYAKIAA
jgi:hypothetical protein